jgi:phosphoglycerate dehydrogenase-like enzyme
LENSFLVGLTRDLLDPNGKPAFDMSALKILEDEPRIRWEFLDENVAEVTPDLARKYDGLVISKPRAGALAFDAPDRRLKIVSRFGVGYDTVDVAAATRAGIVVTNTPDGVRRPVATIILLFVLALSHKLFAKDRLVREGRWHERTLYMGDGLTGKTIGIIGGLGSIGSEAFRLLKPLEMRMLAADPLGTPEKARGLGVELVELETLLRQSDFVCVSCYLDERTRKLVGAREFALMKPTAYLVNTARGPIVDEKALHRALVDRTIAGAAIDVFEEEPTPADNPLLELDNIIVTPHALCWTDECFRGIAGSAFGAMASYARGEAPRYVVNRDVLQHPDVKARLG